jgi:hypothetical protein
MSTNCLAVAPVKRRRQHVTELRSQNAPSSPTRSRSGHRRSAGLGPRHHLADNDRESWGNGAPFGAENGGRPGGGGVGIEPGEAPAGQGRTRPSGDTGALRASPAGCHPGLQGAPSVALDARAARSSMAPPVHAGMARPTAQLNVLAALVPEPSVGPVMHGHRRRPATMEHQAAAAAGAATIARHEPPPPPPRPPDRRAHVQLVGRECADRFLMRSPQHLGPPQTAGPGWQRASE